MLGFIFIILLYVLVFICCGFFKYLYSSIFNKKNKSEEISAPKIYYIKNSTNKKPKPQKPNIAIKGRIIDKDSY